MLTYFVVGAVGVVEGLVVVLRVSGVDAGEHNRTPSEVQTGPVHAQSKRRAWVRVKVRVRGRVRVRVRVRLTLLTWLRVRVRVRLTELTWLSSVRVRVRVRLTELTWLSSAEATRLPKECSPSMVHAC